MTNMQVLILIGAFLLLTVGSFVWYVATWDQRETSSIILPKILPPEASDYSRIIGSVGKDFL